MLTLLHLSDLHFGADHFFGQGENQRGLSTLAGEVHQVLDDQGISIDHIIFTGDYFSKDQFKDFHDAKPGIEAFKALFSLKDDDLSFIPGNHDLSWSSDFKERKYIAYNDLVAAFNRIECQTPNLPAVKRITDDSTSPPVFLALLNSCMVEGPKLAGIGDVTDQQLKALKAKVKKQTAGLENYILVAALHHHLLPVYPVEKIEYPNWPAELTSKPLSSHTLDAIDVLEKLAELNTALVIHGHQHRHALVSYHNKLREYPPLTIAASGSCGSEHDQRQFFVYEILENDIHVRSFRQDRFDSHFKLEKAVDVSIPLPHVSSAISLFCREDAELKNHARAAAEVSEGDNSDLHLLFLSVKDCETSRNIIRRYVWNLPESSACNLHGMYDLLGHWDLLVRLRCPGQFDEAALHQRLITKGQMEKEGTDFVGYQHINVLREAKTFKELLSGDPATPVALERKVLGNTDAYDLKRCQRGLLYFRLPVVGDDPDATKREQDEMIKTLAGFLDSDSTFRNIVEGIYKGKEDLVIESFMTCAQSQALNYLNRTIEKILKKYELQKYTMFCYGYDEREIVAK